MQRVPLGSQPALMARMAEREAEMLEQEREARRRMLTAEARQSEVEYAYTRTAEGILRRNRDLLDRMARVSEAKYAVGKGMQPDVLRAHVAKTRLLEPLAALAGRERSAVATVGAIAPGYAPTASLEAPPGLPALSVLLGRLDAHPMLAMRRLATTHAELALELAERERVPDIGLGLVAGRQMGFDMPYAGAMISLEVPVFFRDKQEARVEAARETLAATRADQDAVKRRLVGQLGAAHAMAEAAQRQLAIYRGGLLAQARQTFQASLAAYQVDRGDFLMVLDAQMALNDVEMAEAMAIAERLKADAMLEALTGPAPKETP
ncbi:MAG: TolC family protein, partial [Candidatus Sericytochromatia bacterium]